MLTDTSLRVRASWLSFALKEYLKHELGEVPYPKRKWNEPW
ncbi:hypothetical protein [Thermococcus siculi]|nr:hypothetical protein [Thermococcus siculi]